MWDVKACRSCLATDCKLERISNVYKRIYACITGLEISDGDGYPFYFCIQCNMFIKKSLAFRRKCRRAFFILKEIMNVRKQVTLNDILTVDRKMTNLDTTYSMSTIIDVNIKPDNPEEIDTLEDERKLQETAQDDVDPTFDNEETLNDDGPDMTNVDLDDVFKDLKEDEVEDDFAEPPATDLDEMKVSSKGPSGRFTDKEKSRIREVYSTNSCRLSCRNKLAVKLCGCKPFYYFYDEGPPCTPAGLACLSAHAAQLRNNGGVRCACGQQCADSVFKEVSRDDQYWKGLLASQGAIRVMVQAPRTRYTREIVFHFQDLVVSFGGAAGLFLGASFISFVEIFYFVFSRFLGTFVGLEPKVEAVKVKYPRVPYEITRIEKLTSILQYQNKYVNK